MQDWRYKAAWHSERNVVGDSIKFLAVFFRLFPLFIIFCTGLSHYWVYHSVYKKIDLGGADIYMSWIFKALIIW